MFMAWLATSQMPFHACGSRGRFWQWLLLRAQCFMENPSRRLDFVSVCVVSTGRVITTASMSNSLCALWITFHTLRARSSFLQRLIANHIRSDSQYKLHDVQPAFWDKTTGLTLLSQKVSNNWEKSGPGWPFLKLLSSSNSLNQLYLCQWSVSPENF